MKQTKRSALSIVLALVLLLGLLPAAALADGPAQNPAYTKTYDYNAARMTDPRTDEPCPGVYTVQPTLSGGEIGIPSIADANLPVAPTTESPAIIMGAAVPYEIRNKGIVQPGLFTFREGVTKVEAPYSYFRWSMIEEANTSSSVDPTAKHWKMSGFDGTYVIVRIDVSKLIEGLTDEELNRSYLHVKQEGNKALLVAVGEATNLTFDAVTCYPAAGQSFTYGTFVAAKAGESGAAALGTKTGSYYLGDGVKAMLSEDGADTQTPYLDVILMASGALVAGGDKSAKDQGDVKLSFYVDETAYYTDHDAAIPAELLPGVQGTYTTAASYAMLQTLIQNAAAGGSGQESQTATTPTLEDLYLKKYFNDTPTNPRSAVTYTVKGSDLALEAMMDEGTTQQPNGATEYWSMSKALTGPYYDGVATEKTGAIIRLMSEVPVLTGLSLAGTKDSPKQRTLDVNSFDIQIADNTSGESSVAGLTLKDAELELMDSNETTGSELAVGNNASMVIDEGGKLIIDPDGQLEVEYDAATQAQGQETGKPISSGVLSILPGGEIINHGVITIEGTEAKEIDPAVGTSTQPTGKGQIVNRGTLTNYGCLSINGEFFNVGVLNNYGSYKDLIVSNDPDKGQFTYHKGIQLSWKDDVTQAGSSTSGGTQIEIRPGMLLNGFDPERAATVAGAALINDGDIVCAPGVIYNFASIRNKAEASVSLGVAVKAVIPIIPSAEQPTVVTKEKILAEPIISAFLNAYSWDDEAGAMVPAILENNGTITTAIVDVPNNGVLGTIYAPAYLDVSSYDVSGSSHLRALVQFDNYGKLYLGEDGKIVLPRERNFNNEMPVSVLNCDSAQLDETAHKGWKMTKNAAGAEAYLTEADVTVAYTTWTATGFSLTAKPVSINSGDTVTLTGTLSVWSVDQLTEADAPALAVSGTGYDKALPCTGVTNDGKFHTFSYSDSFALSDLGTYPYTADLDGRGFLTATASVTVQSPYDPGYIPSGGGSGTTEKETDKDKEQKPEPPAPVSFTDVGETDWFYEAVQFVAQKGYFLGTGEGAFSPALPMTRGMFMAVLARMNGETVDGADWQEKAMAWAVRTGVSDGSAPERPISRQEIVTMLWRFAGSPEPKGDLSARPDGGDADDWAVKAAAWAIENGVMNGDQNGYLRLRAGATRAEVAQFVMNYVTLTAKPA